LASRLAVLNMSALFFSITIFLLIPIIPVYLYRDLGASEQEVGLIIPLAFLTSALLRIPSSLKIKRRILSTLVTGLALNALAIAGYGVSWNPLSFAMFRIMHGVALALNYTLLLTVAGLLAKPGETEKAVTSYTTALALGFWIGPLIGMILREAAQLRYVIFATALLGALPIMFMITLLTGSRLHMEDAAGEGLSLRDVLRPSNILLALVYLSFSLVSGAVFAYGPLKAKIEFGLVDQLIIAFFLIYYFAAFIARLALLKSRRLLESFGLRRLIMLGLLTSALGTSIIGFSRSLSWFGLGLGLAGLAHGLIFPLTASAVALTTPLRLRILGNSFHLTAFDIGSLTGSAVASVLVGFMPISYSLASISISPLLGLLALRRLSNLDAAETK